MDRFDAPLEIGSRSPESQVVGIPDPSTDFHCFVREAAARRDALLRIG
jgi:hypothetical protein